MREPVLSLTSGISYERSAIEAWHSEKGDVCPVTGQNLGFLVANQTLKAEIDDWKQQIKGFRRIKRGSPTTYFLANTKQAPPSSQGGNTTKKRRASEAEHQHSNAKDEMFDMVDKMIQTFTDAGMSDYINRAVDEEHKDSNKTTPSNSLPDLNALIENATSSGYQYNVEYSSIFRQGPAMGSSRSV
jgi:U-box domain